MTCKITDMTESTNIIPTVTIYSAFPVKVAIQETKPPRASEPVSPIKTLAGGALNSKYAINAPTSAKHTVAWDSLSPSKQIIMPKTRKKGILTPEASPSNPSVKFTAFTVAKNTNITNGINQPPSSIFAPKKGK